jgi:hypothetical protein
MRLLVFMAALGLGIGSSFEAPNLWPAIDHALRRFSDASLALIERSLTPVKVQTEPIDATAAANLDEDLDFRIAAQSKTAEGWWAFLDRHPGGVHASVAQEALAQLTGKGAVLATAPQPPPPSPPSRPRFAPVVEVANAPPTPPEPDVFAALERPPPPETKVVEVETTIVKWRERTRYLTHQRLERPHVRRPPPQPFFAWFGPRDPRQLRRY